MRHMAHTAVSLVKMINKIMEPEIKENTDLVLPIICHSCGVENQLSVAFALLAPKEEITNTKTNDHIEITEA